MICGVYDFFTGAILKNFVDLFRKPLNDQMYSSYVLFNGSSSVYFCLKLFLSNRFQFLKLTQKMKNCLEELIQANKMNYINVQRTEHRYNSSYVSLN